VGVLGPSLSVDVEEGGGAAVEKASPAWSSGVIVEEVVGMAAGACLGLRRA